MPRLPDAQALGARPTPRPAGPPSPYRVGEGLYEAAGGALGRAAVQVGRQLEGVAREIEHERDRFDTLAAEDAFTKLRAKQLHLTNDPKEGFLQVKGEHAVKRPLMQEYGQRFEAETQALAKDLGSAPQREKFQRRAEVARLQYDETILRHVTGEREAFGKQALAGAIDVEVQAASLAPFDDNAIGLSRTRILRTLAADAQGEGMDKDAAAAARLKALSAMHTAVIQAQVAARRDKQASEYFAKNRAELTPAARTTIANLLDESSAEGDSQRAFDTIMAQHDAYPARLTAARAIEDPRTRTLTEQRVNQQRAIDEANERETKDARMMQALEIVDKTGNYLAIPAAIRANLDINERNALDARIKSHREPRTGSNYAVFTKFFGLSAPQQADLSEADLMRDYFPHLANPEYEQVVARWRSARDARDGGKDAQLKVSNNLDFDRQVLDTLKGVKAIDQTIQSVAKITASDKAKLYTDFSTAAAYQIEQEELAKKRPLIFSERQVIMDRLIIQRGRVDVSWAKDPAKMIWQMTPQERAKGYVPIEEVSTDTLGVLAAEARRLGLIGVTVTAEGFKAAKRSQIERATFLLLSGAGRDAAVAALQAK